MTQKIIAALMTMIIGASAHAGAFVNRFVQVRPQQRLWVEYKQAENGRPTIFILNGLTYSTKQYKPLVDALEALDPDLGIVLYDMEGMGQTLLDKAPITFNIPFENQLRDLKDLVTTLNLPGPKILAGLSYGGGMALDYLAKYPDDFDKFVAMAPYLNPMASQDTYIKKMIAWTRLASPFDLRTDDRLYDFFLRQLVYTTYPMAEPIVLENPYILEGVFRMAEGAETWNVLNVLNKFPPGKLHLIAGNSDEYIPIADQVAFWKRLPQGVGASFLKVARGPHKLPEAFPVFIAQWLMQIINCNPALDQGITFIGNPERAVATAGTTVIPLKPKVNDCATLLERLPTTR